MKVVLFATRFAQLYFDHLLLRDFLNMHDIHMVLFFHIAGNDIWPSYWLVALQKICWRSTFLSCLISSLQSRSYKCTRVLSFSFLCPLFGGCHRFGCSYFLFFSLKSRSLLECHVVVSSLCQTLKILKEMRGKKFGVVRKKMKREDRGWPYTTTDVHHLVVIIEHRWALSFLLLLLV